MYYIKLGCPGAKASALSNSSRAVSLITNQLFLALVIY